VIEPAIDLDIPRNGRAKDLTLGCNPIQDGALQAFGVIASGTRSAFSDLEDVLS
jgi:hypothetical protein